MYSGATAWEPEVAFDRERDVCMQLGKLSGLICTLGFSFQELRRSLSRLMASSLELMILSVRSWMSLPYFWIN